MSDDIKYPELGEQAKNLGGSLHEFVSVRCKVTDFLHLEKHRLQDLKSVKSVSSSIQINNDAQSVVVG